MTIVQDSCQSWIVVAACFAVYCTNFGMVRISGLIFTESLHYYNADRKSTSFPFLLGSVARGIASPLGGYLSYKFGYQFVVMLGSILSSIGIATCFFARDIRIVAVHWSIYGLGCGLATCLLPQIINLNFTKHATKAIGISLSGPAVAGIIFPFFTVPLLHTYSVPGTYLNLGGILLHSIVGALLLKNPDSARSTSTNKNKFEISDKFHSNQQITKTMHIVGNGNPTDNSKHESDDSDDNNENKQHNKLLRLEENTFQQEKIYLNSVESSNNISNENNAVSNIKPIIDLNEDDNARNKHKWTTSKTYQTNEVDSKGKLKSMNCINICSIFWDPVFIIIAVSASFTIIVYIVVSAILVDLANDKGIALHLHPYLLTAFSTADLVAKVGLGWVIDGNYMSGCRYLALWFSIQAFAFGMMAWSTGFILMTIAVVLIGMVSGSTNATLPRVTAQFIKKEKQAMAIASSNIFFIPMSLSIAPLIGHFRDQLGSYNGLLYIFVAASLLCTTLQLALPTIHQWKEKSKKVISHAQTLKTDA